jgi:hypothetical protein
MAMELSDDELERVVKMIQILTEKFSIVSKSLVYLNQNVENSRMDIEFVRSQLGLKIHYDSEQREFSNFLKKSIRLCLN